MSGFKTVYHCPRCGIPLNQKCDEKCGDCGWNPKVNVKRRRMIQWYSEHELLKLWGKEGEIDANTQDEQRAVAWLKAEIARIAGKTHEKTESFTTKPKEECTDGHDEAGGSAV